MALFGDRSRAKEEAFGFLEQTLRYQFKSHLVLRTILLLLDSLDDLLSDEERRQLQFRCWVLIHAMGLSQQKVVYPLLKQAHIWMYKHPGWSLFDVDLRAELTRWLSALDWRSMERMLGEYYRSLGYDVEELPEGFEALDLLAKTKIENDWHYIGIQVKQWGKKVGQNDVPRNRPFEALKEWLGRRQHPYPDRFYWYAKNGMTTYARQEIESSLKAFFGASSRLICIDLRELVETLLSKSALIPEVLFKVEIARGNLSARNDKHNAQ